MAVPVLSAFFNIGMSVVLALAIAAAYYLHTQKKKSDFIAMGVMFGVYIFDNTIVFCTESIPRFAEVYDRSFVSTPAIKTVYFIILIGCMLYTVQRVMPAFSMRSFVGLLGIYAICLICAPLIPENDWMVWIYYLPTQLLIIGVSLWGLIMLRKDPGAFHVTDIPIKRVLLWFLCMGTAVLVEDTIVIFFVDRFYGPEMKIHNRSFTENILFLGQAVLTIQSALNMIKRREFETGGVVAAGYSPGKSPLKAFCIAYGLTEREQEILQRLLEGKSQQEISDELVIALGTVKTHIHNIYQKAGAANRNQIVSKYQEFGACAGEEAALSETVSV